GFTGVNSVNCTLVNATGGVVGRQTVSRNGTYAMKLKERFSQTGVYNYTMECEAGGVGMGELFWYYYDNVRPSIALEYPATTTAANATINITATDALSPVIACNIRGGATYNLNSGETASVDVTLRRIGRNRFTFSCVDYAKNRARATATITRLRVP
ncbi:MAG: hypothetical protein PHS02_03900, partial [Candidatus ainarchaeum sp.]|nr:hypothetical protein [Candidatus ainarchaeum sp.]